jgi:hypothetical protein
MVNGRAAIGTGAPGAVDQRRLLLGLGRAIDEEVAAVTGCDGAPARGERDRMRLGYLCTLTGRIRGANTCEPGGGIGRRAGPSPEAGSVRAPVPDRGDPPGTGRGGERRGW